MNVPSFEPLHEEIRAHAARDYPREACGVILIDGGAMRYMPCRNRARGTEHFILHEEDYVAAADAGEVVAIVHSHPDASAAPSMADRVMCEQTMLPWLICGWPSGLITVTRPQGFRAPLLGREFAHGVLDCYALVRDYYAAIGIEIPDFERRDGWWNEPGTELYLTNFEAAGFVEVSGEPRLHDVILMQVLSDQANHAAVFIGDGAAFARLIDSRGEPPQAQVSGGQLIVHHLFARLSCRDIYGGYWQRHTRKIVRHRKLLDAA